MPIATRRRSYRPSLEAFEKRDVPAVGLAGPIAAMPPHSPIPYTRVEIPPRAPRHVLEILERFHQPQDAKNDSFASLAMIDESSLRPGDMLVSTEAGRISNIIRNVTSAAYSHASLYIGDGKIIDATDNGVQQRNLSDLTGPAIRVGVIRVGDLTESRRNQVVAAALKMDGAEYNHFGLGFGGVVEATPAFRVYRWVSGSPGKVTGSSILKGSLGKGYFCSEMVIKAYGDAGITIADERGDSPGGIITYAAARPSQFQFVGRLAIGGH